MAPEPDPDRIVRALAEAAASERAPAGLRERIDAMSRAPRRRARRWLLVPAGGLIAAGVLAVVLLAPGGAPGGPSVAQAAAVVIRGGWGAIPQQGSPYSGARLRGGPALPHWAGGRAWRAAGTSFDYVHGRLIVNASYRRSGRLVIYSVATGAVLRGQRSGYRSFRLGGWTVISWQESGHSCLMASDSASAATLVALARRR